MVEVHWSPVGEAYVTPVADDRVGHRGAQRRARRPLAELLAAFPPLAGRLAGPRPVGGVRGAGPLRQRSRRRVAGRVLLVGDAAGYVDALTGEGIALGLAQARAAVAAVRGRAPASATSGPGGGSGGATTCSPRGCSPRPGTRPCAAGWCRRRPRCRGVFGAAVNQLARPA